MKKQTLLLTAGIAMAICGILFTGCPGGGGNDGVPDLAGKLLILQAYGSSSDAAGISHSFVELYNNTNAAINLNGISLYYAAGTSVSNGNTNNATEDHENGWERVSLDGGIIPAKSSFLILGTSRSTLARYQMPDNYGDKNDSYFSLDNRAFKVALVRSAETTLNMQNPFDVDGTGTKIAGYIDMVGAANDYNGRDLIFGFETAPARNSASEAVRRKDLNDTDDNKGGNLFPLGNEASVTYAGDFVSVRYAFGDSSTNRSITDEELAVLRPKNTAYGSWNPFAAPAPPVPPVATDNKLLILQAGASTDGAISHSFVELYNNSDTTVNLNTYSLQCGVTGTDWTVINLTGTIPAKGSYFVLGTLGTVAATGAPNTNARVDLSTFNPDQTETFVLSNDGFKVALMSNQTKLTVANPYNTDGNKTRAAGYVDLLGATNGTNPDAYEAKIASVISKQATARRGSLVDYDDNVHDFVRIDYRTSGTTNAVFEARRPRGSSVGNWDPFADPEPPVVGEGSPKLMILQANTYGNNSNGGFSKSLVELYNNTDAAINLDGYYLHIGNKTEWTYQINLSGKTIPSEKSFLIVSSTENVADTSADLPTEDLSANFGIANDNFKIALMRNNRSTLSVTNPFGDASLTADYVDMLGVGTDTNGFETAVSTGQSRPRPVRRASLSDTDNNSTDFVALEYRTNQPTRITTPDFYKYWPRSASMDAWDPITGLPAVQPQNIHSRHNPSP